MKDLKENNDVEENESITVDKKIVNVYGSIKSEGYKHNYKGHTVGSYKSSQTHVKYGGFYRSMSQYDDEWTIIYIIFIFLFALIY